MLVGGNVKNKKQNPPKRELLGGRTASIAVYSQDGDCLPDQ